VPVEPRAQFYLDWAEAAAPFCKCTQSITFCVIQRMNKEVCGKRVVEHIALVDELDIGT